MKKILSVVLFVVALLSNFSVNAQNDLVVQNMPLPKLGKKFTVVAHVVLDTLKDTGIDTTALKNTIKNQMSAYFSPIGVSFEVCKINLIPNYSFDDLDVENEDREMYRMHHIKNRINLFIVANVPVPPGVCGKTKVGAIANLDDEGIIMKKACLDAGSLAHEFGHYFGLLHTFEKGINGAELVDGSNSATAGDAIADTPADPYVFTPPVFLVPKYLKDYTNCLFINKTKDTKGDYYVPEVGNLMSYYTPCYCGFTAGQLRKMAAVYQAAPKKMW